MAGSGTLMILNLLKGTKQSKIVCELDEKIKWLREKLVNQPGGLSKEQQQILLKDLEKLREKL